MDREFAVGSKPHGRTGRTCGAVESLLMPGQVTKAHAKLEEVCSDCHDRTDRARQSALCLDCHKPIAADLREHKGYHGRMPNAAPANAWAVTPNIGA